MAISSYKIFLMKKTLDNYEKLIDIKEFPNIGGEPELLETTTLSDGMQTYITGIQKNEGMKFKANYTKTDYDKVKKLEGTEGEFAVWFGATGEGSALTPTGSDGKFEFKGVPSVYVEGAGVNDVVDMSIMIAPTTPVTVGTA